MEPIIGPADLFDDPGVSGLQGCSAEEKIPVGPVAPVPRVDSFFNFQLVVFQVYSVIFVL